MRDEGKHLVAHVKRIRSMHEAEAEADAKTKFKETTRGGLAVNVVECRPSETVRSERVTRLLQAGSALRAASEQVPVILVKREVGSAEVFDFQFGPKCVVESPRLAARLAQL